MSRLGDGRLPRCPAFFDAHLRGRPDTSHLLTGASLRHPEIRYVAG
jgi:hypothetical protein